MKNLLIINASVRSERSHSRKLTQSFIENWKSKHPDDIYNFREVGTEVIPAINESWILGAFTLPENRNEENQKGVKLSDELIKELKANDIYVIGAPMYNWSIPSGLKAYIDQIMRINETWRFRSGVPDGDYVGLLKNKTVYILSSRGDTGYGINEKNEHMNFQTTYLKFIFEIMGVKNIYTYSLDNEEFGGEIFEISKKQIFETIKTIE